MQARLLAPLLSAEVVTLADLGSRGLYRRLTENPPDVVHAWRLPALRAASALKPMTRGRWKLVASEPFRGGRTNAIDHWLLSRADRAATPPLAVARAAPGELPLALPAGARVVMVVGPVKATHGGREAVWAADILKYAVPELQLVIVGDGPDLARVRAFARSVSRMAESTHLVPRRPDAAALLA